ncbi:MAG: PIN domain-containing protein [Geobacteraceae bacterium]
MYLVDTNIWLELLLQQDKAGEVTSFFQTVDASSLAITDFTLYSIGIILTRLKKYDVFDDFVVDTLEENSVNRICLDPLSLKRISSVQKQFGLDFDDAYQYVAATENELTLVSFDSDFDKTPLGRKTPAEIS